MTRPKNYTSAGAEIDGEYRYRLWRAWDPFGDRVAFIMLNPSTADGSLDDPTIRRCVRFASDWGYGGLRATDPREIKRHPNPHGPRMPGGGMRNGKAIDFVCRRSDLVIAAWGARAIRSATSGTEELMRQVRDVHVLALTAEGLPRHPLMMRADVQPRLWLKRRGTVS